MAAPQRSNGRPEPEVIASFADGLSYSKNKLEETFRSGILERPAKPTTKDPVPKKEDVDLIVSELEIPRLRAEKALIENEGDVTKALQALVTPS